MRSQSDITRSIFIPIKYYAFVLAPLCQWEILIELDLITLEFYNYSEYDGVNLAISGDLTYVKEAIDYFQEEIQNFDIKTFERIF